MPRQTAKRAKCRFASAKPPPPAVAFSNRKSRTDGPATSWPRGGHLAEESASFHRRDRQELRARRGIARRRPRQRQGVSADLSPSSRGGRPFKPDTGRCAPTHVIFIAAGCFSQVENPPTDGPSCRAVSTTRRIEGSHSRRFRPILGEPASSSRTSIGAFSGDGGRASSSLPWHGAIAEHRLPGQSATRTSAPEGCTRSWNGCWTRISYEAPTRREKKESVGRGVRATTKLDEAVDEKMRDLSRFIL